MALLAEYALTPDVFDVASYTSEEVCGLHLQNLKEVLLQEGLVRDLRLGDWGRLFVGNDRSWHLRGKELLKKLKSQNRLVSFPSANVTAPATYADWCSEALATHRILPLSGIIVSEGQSAAHRANPAVASVGRLTSTPWWMARSPSLRLARTLTAYRAALGLVLRHANSLMFIDPYLDPSNGQYTDFLSLMHAAGGRASAPRIEIHRAAWYDGGQEKRPQVAAVEAALRSGLTECARQTGLTFNVSLWDVMHDRYLISDILGITLPHGFATTRAPNAVTTWSQLGRKDRDDVQREFDVDARQPRHQFRVG
jgi:hypothetical protein